MKYAVIKIVNGNFSIVSEGWTSTDKAKVSYHSTLTNLYNDISNIDTMAVMIMDSMGNIIERDFYDKSMTEVIE